MKLLLKLLDFLPQMAKMYKNFPFFHFLFRLPFRLLTSEPVQNFSWNVLDPITARKKSSVEMF